MRLQQSSRKDANDPRIHALIPVKRALESGQTTHEAMPGLHSNGLAASLYVCSVSEHSLHDAILSHQDMQGAGVRTRRAGEGCGTVQQPSVASHAVIGDKLEETKNRKDEAHQRCNRDHLQEHYGGAQPIAIRPTAPETRSAEVSTVQGAYQQNSRRHKQQQCLLGPALHRLQWQASRKAKGRRL